MKRAIGLHGFVAYGGEQFRWFIDRVLQSAKVHCSEGDARVAACRTAADNMVNLVCKRWQDRQNILKVRICILYSALWKQLNHSPPRWEQRSPDSGC